jgi:hypothetical protein
MGQIIYYYYVNHLKNRKSFALKKIKLTLEFYYMNDFIFCFLKWVYNFKRAKHKMYIIEKMLIMNF